MCEILENTLVAKSSGKHSAGQHGRDLKHLGHLFKLCMFLNVLKPGEFKEETGQENLTICFEKTGMTPKTPNMRWVCGGEVILHFYVLNVILTMLKYLVQFSLAPLTVQKLRQINMLLFMQ